MIPLAVFTRLKFKTAVLKGLGKIGNWVLENPVKIFFVILISALLITKCSLDNAKKKIEEVKQENAEVTQTLKESEQTIASIPEKVKETNRLREALERARKEEERRLAELSKNEMTVESINKMWQDRLTELEEASK